MTFEVIGSYLYEFFLWTLPFLGVLGIVVIVHELGHFLAARALGIEVDTFSIGFGPEITGFNDKHGTRWRIAWVPLGGYVKFKGDENAASMPTLEDLEGLTPDQKIGHFHTSALWRRALVVLAGPMANFLLGVVVFTGWFAAGVEYEAIGIKSVLPDSPAAQAGFKAGDKVMAVDGTQVVSAQQFQQVIFLNARSQIDVLIEREGRPVHLKTVPMLTDKTCVGRIGVELVSENKQIVRPGLGQAFYLSLKNTRQTLIIPFHFLGKLAQGSACANQLSGPVKIAQASKQLASESLLNLIPLIGFLSISIGLFNLFPIPVLDGGHLLFYGTEAILGKPLNKKAQEISFRIGLALLLMLMIFVTGNNLADILWPS